MPLEIRPVTRQDFASFELLKHNHGGDLIGPLVPILWADSRDDAEMAPRNEWSLKQQREMFEDDPSATFLKVVDTEKDDEPLALARWHYYPQGFKHPEFTAWELNGRAPDADSTWPDEIKAPFIKALYLPVFGQRASWMGSRPQLVLTTIITRTSMRRRGAGSMLVEWGLEQARRDHVPAYPEASTAGAPVYEKLGFKRVGEVRLDLSAYGLEQEVLARMAADLQEDQPGA